MTTYQSNSEETEKSLIMLTETGGKRGAGDTREIEAVVEMVDMIRAGVC